MKVHHLSCGTMCPPAARLVNGHGSLFGAAHMICHCLLVETSDALVLVDTGLGTADVALPSRLPRLYRSVTRPVLDPAETAVARVRALGFDPRDVRHIVVTHLDLDHAGGLPDFPEATVHVHAIEHAVATARADRSSRARYLPTQLSNHQRWQTYDGDGDDWFGLRALRPLIGVAADIALVPLAGHTSGHSGVAVRAGDRWLLHAGDAYFNTGELSDPPRTPLGLAIFQRALAVDDRARRENQTRLGALRRDHAGEVEVFCAHDPAEYPA